MGDEVQLDGDGLSALARQCESAATRLTATTELVAGPPFLATTKAVALGFTRVNAAAAALAERATATGNKLRMAASAYTATDFESAEQMSARANTMPTS